MEKSITIKLIFCVLMLWIIQGNYFIHPDIKWIGYIEMIVGIVGIEIIIVFKFIPFIKNKFEDYLKSIIV